MNDRFDLHIITHHHSEVYCGYIVLSPFSFWEFINVFPYMSRSYILWLNCTREKTRYITQYEYCTFNNVAQPLFAL